MKNLCFLFILFSLFSCQQHSVTITSPDGKTSANYRTDEIDDNFYSVDYEGKSIIKPSFIGFETTDLPPIGVNMKIISVTESEVRQSWKPVYGERSKIADNYNQAIIHLRETITPNRDF